MIPEVVIRPASMGSREGLEQSIQMLLLLTALTVAPAFLVMTTSFTRIIIVLSFLRSGLGAQQVPPNMVLLGLALFLTYFTMQPTIDQVNETAVKPFMAKQLSEQQAVQQAYKPLQAFMLQRTRKSDLKLFVDMAKLRNLKRPSDVPAHVLIPAYSVSELKTAFEIGFLIFVPFLVIDMVVASILMSMGMMMLPPVMVSMPLKLLLFVLADGWGLLLQGLARGIMGG
jgi:flagellar biosynthetic protein FliP